MATVALVLFLMQVFQMARSQVLAEVWATVILSTQLLTRRVRRQFIQISTELFLRSRHAYIASDTNI